MYSRSLLETIIRKLSLIIISEMSFLDPWNIVLYYVNKAGEQTSQRARKSGPTSGRQRFDVATSYRCRPDVGPTFLAGWDYIESPATWHYYCFAIGKMKRSSKAAASRANHKKWNISQAQIYFDTMNKYETLSIVRNEVSVCLRMLCLRRKTVRERIGR